MKAEELNVTLSPALTVSARKELVQEFLFGVPAGGFCCSPTQTDQLAA